MDAPFNCNLHEALAILEDNEDLEPLQIFIEPPDPAVHSDEDSGDEDAGAFINNLTGRQLSAPCEVVLAKSSQPHRACRKRARNASPPETISARGDSTRRRGVRASRGRGRVRSHSCGRGCGNTSTARAEVSSSSTGDDSHGSDVEEPARKKTKPVRTWVKGDLSKSLPTFPDGDYSSYRGKSPLEMFEIFWEEEVIKLLVDQSTKYAAFLNCPNPNITHDEMKAFIAILIISGYNTVL